MKNLVLVILISFSFNIKSVAQTDSVFLKTGWYFVSENKGVYMQLEGDTFHYFINASPILTAKNIRELSIHEAKNGTSRLLMNFDDQGTKNRYLATLRSIGLRLAFVFNNKLYYVPVVNSEVESGIASLEGKSFDKERLEKIKASIEKEKLGP